MKLETNYIETKIPLTQSQLMLWVGQKLNPTSPMYNMAHSFEICGSINENVFKKSFQDLIAAFDVFRITFSEEKGIPFQNILENLNYDLIIEDVSNLDFQELEPIMQKRTMQLLDVHHPLFDSVLYKLGEYHYVWFLNIHHLVTDATSSTIIFDNFTKIYRQNLEGLNAESIEIPQYRSYLKFEENIAQDISNDNVRHYWKDAASKVTAPPILYGQKAKEIASLSHRVIVKLGENRTTKLAELAAKTEIRCWTKDLTYFNIFLTALFVYIKRVSNEDKLAIGALSHSRVTKEFKKTAGMFVELFPLIAEFSEDDTFLSLYNKVRNETNEYLRNAQPGMASAEASRGFNVVLNYIKANFSDFNRIPVKSNWIHPNHCDAAHHMRCTVYDMDGTGDIELFFDLNTAIFNKDQQKQIPEHFLAILDAFLEDTEQLIDQPSIINRLSVVEELNDFKFNNSYRPFLEVISDVIKNNSEKAAIREGSKTYSYAELSSLSNAFAHTLIKQGVTAGDKVGVHSYRSADYVIALLAILKLNAVFVPISANQPKERIGYIIENSECAFIVTDTELRTNLVDIKVPIINLSDDSWRQNNLEIEIPFQESKPNQIAFILYTSGSTGKPKGVLLTHNSLSNYLFNCNTIWGENLKFAFCTSISFDITYTAIFLPLYHAGEIIVYKEDLEGPDAAVVRVLEDNKADSIVLTPSHLVLFLGKGHSDSKLRNIIVLGEEFKTDLANKIQNEYHPDADIYNFYGPTETTIATIITKFNSEIHTNVAVPIGKPIENMIALVLDSHLNRVPKGVVGTLYLGGYGVAEGYVKKPELTAERFITNPYLSSDTLYNTGDLVRINDDDEFEFLGRKDSQVKLNGQRIELSEIECVLEDFEGVKEAVSLVIEHKDDLKKSGQLVAFYTSSSEIESSELRLHLEKKLPQYMIPLQFKFLKEFPLTQSAKTDRKALSKNIVLKFESNTTYAAPTNEIEEIIANVWSELLNIEKIGIHDNFISLGGHSLLAMRITSSLNEMFEMQNPLDKIFVYPTIATYAKYIEDTLISLLAE